MKALSLTVADLNSLAKPRKIKEVVSNIITRVDLLLVDAYQDGHEDTDDEVFKTNGLETVLVLTSNIDLSKRIRDELGWKEYSSFSGFYSFLQMRSQFKVLMDLGGLEKIMLCEGDLQYYAEKPEAAVRLADVRMDHVEKKFLHCRKVRQAPW